MGEFEDLLNKFQMIDRDYSDSAATDYVQFFMEHAEFPFIWSTIQEWQKLPNFPELPEQERQMDLEEFCKKIFPLSRVIVTSLPLEQRRNIYKPYIEKIFRKMEEQIFYADENIKKLYRNLCSVKTGQIEENKRYKNEIQVMTKKLAQLNNNPEELNITLRERKQNLEQEIEQLKNRKLCIE